MVPSGATELIWHFAGYLCLPPPDIKTMPTLYEGALGKMVPEEDEAVSHAAARRPPDALDTESPAVPVPDLVLAEDGAWAYMTPFRLHGMPRMYVNSFKAKVPHDLRPPARAGGGGGGSHRHDSADGDVAYRDGGDQEMIDVRQINVMQDDDIVVVGNFTLHLPDGSDALQSMVHAAGALGPDAVRIAECDSASITEFAVARDASLANIPAADEPHPVVSEQHCDGVLNTDPDIHQPTSAALDNAFATLETPSPPLPAATGDGSEHHVQTVSLGGNIAINDTIVSDYAGLSGTLVVLGDYFRTASIVQTNVLLDHNWFGVAGDGSNGAFEDSANTVHNIADVIVQGDNGASEWHAGGPFHWSVDVLDGSFYDIKSLVLTNVLSDNDTVSHLLSTGHSQIVLGSNGMVNLSDFQNLSAEYDLIIVEGNYHQANFLHQTNVVLTCNTALLDHTGTGEAGESAGSWSIEAGGNALINDARILDLGSYSFQPVNDDILDLLQRLESREQFDAATVKDAFPTLVGTVNVLFITGDYYDITYVSQTNIVSDVNVAALQSNGGDQILSTGGNQAINAVTVVNGGSLTSPYLQGDFYNDTILVQANIVMESDKVAFNDPAKLASELVAFTASDDAIPHDVLPPPSADLHHHHDVLADMLH